MTDLSVRQERTHAADAARRTVVGRVERRDQTGRKWWKVKGFAKARRSDMQRIDRWWNPWNSFRLRVKVAISSGEKKVHE